MSGISFPHSLDQWFPKAIKSQQPIIAHCIVHGLERAAKIGIDFFLNADSFVKKKELEDPITDYNFSLAHLCVIYNRQEVLQKLFDIGAKLDNKDARGSTPCHHAAMLGNFSLMHWLSEHKGSPDALNHRNLTADEIVSFAYPKFKENEEKNPTKEKELLIKGCSESFKECQELFIDPVELYKDWKNPQRVKCSSNELLENYYKDKKNTPKVYLAKVTKDDRGNPLPRCIGQGLFAREPIAKGAFLGEYIGEYCISKTPSNPYVFLNIDAEKIGNEMTRINDAFPLAMAYPLVDPKGFFSRILFFAKEDIPEGTEITVNFNAYHSAKQDHIELRPLALENFFEDLKTFQAEAFCTILDKAPVLDLSLWAQLENFKYLLDTPTSLVLVMCEKSIDFEQLRTIFNNSTFKRRFNIYEEALSWFETVFKFNSILGKLNNTEVKKRCLREVKLVLPKNSRDQLLEKLFGLTTFFSITMENGTLEQLTSQDINSLIDIIKKEILNS